MTIRVLTRRHVAILLLILLACVPVASSFTEHSYYITFVTRILVMGLAAVGLNLVLGYGGMVSFGHALYIGIGAYAAGMLSAHGISSGAAHLAVALGVGAIAALGVGTISLRTQGMAFLMITLAFAQMFYFLVVSLKQYGGEDGLALAARSDFGAIDLAQPTVFYYLTLGILVVTLLLLQRLVHSRFGMVVQGIRSNERRMIALGYPVLRYKLAAYVLSALICVLAGVLLANLGRFASPSYMQWSVSGELIVMVVLGGIGTLFGPVVGAAVLLSLEELLANVKLGISPDIDSFLNTHWMAVLGIFIVVATLNLKKGIFGSLPETEEKP